MAWATAISTVLPLAPASSDPPRAVLVDRHSRSHFASQSEADEFLWVGLTTPDPTTRGKLGFFIDEAIESALQRRGAAPPGIGAGGSFDSMLGDQLYRARLLDLRGLALSFGSLAPIAGDHGVLNEQDSAVLRWWVQASAERTLRLFLDSADQHLGLYDAPVRLGQWLERVQPQAPHTRIEQLSFTESLESPESAELEQSLSRAFDADRASTELFTDLLDLPSAPTSAANRNAADTTPTEPLDVICAPLIAQEDRSTWRPEGDLPLPLEARPVATADDAETSESLRYTDAAPSQMPADSSFPPPADADFEAQADVDFEAHYEPRADSDFEARADSSYEAHYEARADSNFEARADSNFEARADSNYDEHYYDDDDFVEDPETASHSATLLDELLAGAYAASKADPSAVLSQTLGMLSTPLASERNDAEPAALTREVESLTTNLAERAARAPNLAERAAPAPSPEEAPDTDADTDTDTDTDAWQALAAANWQRWMREIDGTRGPKPLSTIERLFTSSYVPLREALAQGLASAEAQDVLDAWAKSFEQSYAEAFDAIRVRPKRPTMVLDVPDIALRLSRLHGARSTQLVLVDGLRYDLGLRVQRRLKSLVGRKAALTESVLLWSALPTTTAVQLDLLAGGSTALKTRTPVASTEIPVARGRGAHTLRRVKAGQRELLKLDVVEADLSQPGPSQHQRLDALARDTAECLANHLLRLPARTLVFVFGDHGFEFGKLDAGTASGHSGGASPEQVLVPGMAWLVGDVH